MGIRRPVSNDKRPTNSDIYKKLEAMDNRIISLETWRIASDAGVAAVDNYKRANEKKTIVGMEPELIKALLLALGIIGTLIAIAWK